MKIRYDAEIDAIYFDLSETKSFDSEEIQPGIIYDYDQNNKIVGIEILDFTWQKNNGLKIDNLPFNSEDKKIAAQYFGIPLAV